MSKLRQTCFYNSSILIYVALCLHDQNLQKKKRFWQSRRDHNWCVLTVSSCTCLCLFIFSMLFCFISIRARRTDRRTDGRTHPLIEMRESGLMNLEPEMSRTRRTRRYFMLRKRGGVGGGHYVEKGVKVAIFHRAPASLLFLFCQFQSIGFALVPQLIMSYQEQWPF